MKKFKKIFLGLCLINLLVVVLGVNKVKALVPYETTTFNGSQYRITEVVEQNKLHGGVVHTKYKAESSYTRDTNGSYVGYTHAGMFYPQSVNVLEVPNNGDVKVVQWSFHSATTVEWTLTTVVKMAENYESLHPGYKVIAAINGDFFDINSTASYGPLLKSTRGVGVSDGEVIRAMDARGLETNPLTIGFKNDGSLTNYVQGGKIEFTENHMLALYDADGKITDEFEIKSINAVPADGEIAVYYSYPTGVGEVAKSQAKQLVEMPANNAYVCEKPIRIVPNSNTALYAKGELAEATETRELAFGEFGIVTTNQSVRSKIDAAAYVRVQKNVIGDYADCESIGGGVYTMLQDGKEVPDGDSNRHPRTMIGAKADGSIVMATVDGRQKNKNMYGMTADEQGALMKQYGCVSAVNLDGGGSTTIAIRNEKNKFDVLNSPSDGNLRNDSNCYLVVMKEADFSIKEQNITDESIEFVLDTTGVDWSKTTAIKCKFNGQTKEVVDGKVKFDNLTNNSTYKYAFYYDTRTQKDIETLLAGEINSAKKTPTFGDLTIEVQGNKVIFNPTITDPDEALDYYRIFINNSRNPYLGEPIEVKYDTTGLKELEFDILICYNLNDGKGKQEFTEHVVHKLEVDEPVPPVEDPVDPVPPVEKPDEPQNPTQPNEPSTPTTPEKKGCKKDLTFLVMGIISLATLGILLKKREK